MTEAKFIHHMQSEEELSALLAESGVPVNQYGKGEAKTISHLLNEVLNGECRLIQEEEVITRQVEIASVRVHYQEGQKKLYLREKRQVFRDGRERTRDWFTWSISEKVKNNETSKDAAIRAMKEELGIKAEQGVSKAEIDNEDIESPSYPGIRTRYEVNYFDIELTESQFRPEGYVEKQKDKTTYWEWEEVID